MQTKKINWNGPSIQYNVTGEGKTVVLLHGFGEDSTVWQPQIDFLQNHFRIIVPDIPGSGHSEYVPDAHIETYAELLTEIIDIELQKVSSIGGDSEGVVSLIGHSMGGYVSLAFADKHPQYLHGCRLFQST